MDFDSVVAVCGGFLCVDEKKKRKVPRLWAKQWLLQRNKFSHISLLSELATNEPKDFQNYLRMNEETFQELLGLVSSIIERKNTNMRECVSSKERLVATLQFLASGRSYENLKFSCAISAQALGRIIPETCAAIVDVLKDDYLKVSIPSKLACLISITDIWNKVVKPLYASSYQE